MLAFVSIFTSQLLAQQTDLTPEQIYNNTQNSVVFIVVYDKDGSLLSYGSGVIISEDGLVYTSYHVIDYYDRIEIRNGSTVYNQVAIAGFNPLFDAAVLKIMTEDNFPDYIKTAESLPNVGEVVYALGNPQGYTKTLSQGLISGIRDEGGINQIQYTASTSPGSSGGAIFNASGELLGITCSTNTLGQNLNFAVPVKYYQNIATINNSDLTQKNSIQHIFDVFNNKGSQKDYDHFESVQNYLTNIQPNVNSYLLVSELFKKFSRNDSSVIYLTKAIELEPQNALLYRLRGDAYSMISVNDSSIVDYNTALSIDPNYIDAYLGRALLYELSLNDYRKAAADYTQIINISPEYNYLYTYRSTCFLNLGDTVRALQDLNKSFSFDQKLDYNYSKRAKLYTDLKMYYEAIWDYTEAIKLNPTNSDYYFSRGILYSKTGQNYLAIDDYNTYYKYDDDEMAYNNIAYGYLAENDYENAERYFNKSLFANNRHLVSYLGLSILNFRQGNIKKTLLNMSKAIEINPLLDYGISGIAELEKQSWFWDDSEKSDFKKIFRMMGIKSRKIKHKDNKTNNKVRADDAN